MIFLVILPLACTFLVAYLLWTRHYNYWQTRNVKCIEPSFPFGSIKDVFLGKKNLAALIQEFYETYPNESLIGFYSPNKPFLLVRSPELAKEVLVTKFKDFSESGFEMPTSQDPLYGNNPFALQNYEEWRKVRAVHSPLMTPRSVKQMVEDMKKPAESFTRYLALHCDEPLNVMDICRNFTVDSVASVAYGLESDWFFKPETAFMINSSEKLFGTSNAMWYSNTASFFFPWLFKVARLTFVSDLAQNYFKAIAEVVVAQRKKSNMTRQDLTQRIINLDESAEKNGAQKFTISEIGSHFMTFFVDGTETTSTVLICLLYELAKSPECQNKLREEIQKMGQTTDDFDGDIITSIEYLDMCIQETIRLHPSVPMLSRRANKDTSIGPVKIPKGMQVFVASGPIQVDGRYHEDSLKFVPTRHTKENRVQNMFTHMPFGQGPRICLGYQYGNMNIKVAMINILLNFNVETCEKTTPFELCNSSFFFNVPKPIYLKFTKLTSKKLK